jgi:uncharacterized protein involved in exopolysaccharide biosynthesis
MNSTLISTPPQHNDQTQLGLADLLVFFWSARWAILIGSVLGLSLSLLFIRSATYQYTATLMVTPTKTETARLPGNISGLAAIAGLSLPGGGSANDFNLYVVGLHSREVAARLARDRKIMQTLFASQYDIRSGQWFRPNGFIASFSSAVKLTLQVPGAFWRPPDAADLQKFFENNIKIMTDRKTNITTISIDYKDPEFAIKLILDLHEETDAVLRRQALARADDSIVYLEKQLLRVQLAEHRQALAEMLGEQEKARMLASSDAPYSAQPFGTAFASSSPTSPKPLIVLVIGIVGGAIVGFGAMLARPISQSVRQQIAARSRTN